MGHLLIIGLALGLVVSAAGLLYPFWPFGRRWQALLVGVAAFAALALTAPQFEAPSDGVPDGIAASDPVELASRADTAD